MSNKKRTFRLDCRALILCVLGIGFMGCSPERRFSQAKEKEQKGEYQQAWEAYQEFAAKYPRHSLAPEALFRSGKLAQNQLGDCVVAKAFYEMVVQRYPQSSPWAFQAAYAKNNCPDFFPLLNGFKWIEGDSETHGRNARIEITCHAPEVKSNKGFAGEMEKTYFAGESKFKTIGLYYKKTDLELLEFVSKQDPRAKTILMWPLTVGTKWTTKMDGRTFRYEIIAGDKVVKVQAGEFHNCLQVRSVIEGLPGATNEYYAPDVGRILVTISTNEGEKRNTELISFTPFMETALEDDKKDKS